jgi:hypothetical protein
MPFSFRIPIPEDLEGVFENFKREIARNRGSLQGDLQSGRISASGVQGRYTVCENFINITVTRKPFFLSNSFVENFIRNKFREASA